MNINTPNATPSQSPRELWLWHLRRGTIKEATDHQLELAADSCEQWELRFAGLVIVAVAAEFVFALIHPPYDSLWNIWGTVIADAGIAFGIIGEVICGRLDARIQTELRKRSTDRLADIEVANGFLGVEMERARAEAARANARAAEANERASKADLARAELEAKLLPRTLSQEQRDFIQTLRGRFAEIAIAFETDVETQYFAASIRDAFWAAGIKVATYPRAAGIHSSGILIYEPKGLDGSRPRTVEPLIEIFRKGDLIGPMAVIGEVPNDVVLSFSDTRPELKAPLNTPMIVVGGRFILPPPHLERAAKAAKAAMDKMKKNP